MAGASGAIASFFMDLVYRINESSEQKFTRSIDASEKSAESLSKTLVDLGKVMQELGSKLGAGLEEPARKFANSSHKVKETAEGLNKGFKSLGVTAIAAGTAWAAGINKVTKEYSALYIQARLIGGTVTDLKNAGDAAEKAGSSAGKLQGAAASLTSAVRSNIASKGMVERIIGTDFEDTVKKVGVVKGALIPVFRELEAMVKAHGGNRNLAYLTAESFYGLSKADLDWYLAFGKDWEKQEERIAKVRKDAGLDQERSAKQANQFWMGMSRIGDAIETIWLQTFDTIVKPLQTVIDLIGDGLELVTKINAAVPGLALAETLGAALIGAKLFIGALGKITSLFGGVGNAAKLAGGEAAAALGGAAGGLAGKAFGKAWGLAAHTIIIAGVHATLDAAKDWIDAKFADWGGPDFVKKQAENTIREAKRKEDRGIVGRVLEAPEDALSAVGLGFGPPKKALEYLQAHPEMPGAKEYFEKNPQHLPKTPEGEKPAEAPKPAQKRTGFHTQGAQPIMEPAPVAAQPTGQQKPVEVIVKNPVPPALGAPVATAAVPPPLQVTPRPGGTTQYHEDKKTGQWSEGPGQPKEKPWWSGPVGKPAEGAPGAEVNRNPSYAEGGIVPINAHAGEIVLPASLSRGLLAMVHAIQGGGGARDDGTTKKSAGSVLDWLGGLLVPRVKIDNTDDLKPEDEELKKATEEAAKASGAGGGGGKPFSGFYNQQGQSTSGGAPAAGGTYMSGGVPVTTDGGGGGGGHAGHGHAGGGGGAGVGEGPPSGEVGKGASAYRAKQREQMFAEYDKWTDEQKRTLSIVMQKESKDALESLANRVPGEAGTGANKGGTLWEGLSGKFYSTYQGAKAAAARGEGSVAAADAMAAKVRAGSDVLGGRSDQGMWTDPGHRQMHAPGAAPGTQINELGKARRLAHINGEWYSDKASISLAKRDADLAAQKEYDAKYGGGAGAAGGGEAAPGGDAAVTQRLNKVAVDNAKLGGASSVGGVHPEFQARIDRMMQAMPENLRAKFKIYSGFRDAQRQAHVHGSVKHSHHTGTGAAGTGMAVDTTTDPAMLDWIHKEGGKFGVGYPLAGPGSGVEGALNIPGEGHHLEPTEGGRRITNMAAWVKQQDAKRAQIAAKVQQGGQDAEKKGQEAGAAEKSPIEKFNDGLIKAAQDQAAAANAEAARKGEQAGEKVAAEKSPIEKFNDKLIEEAKNKASADKGDDAKPAKGMTRGLGMSKPTSDKVGEMAAKMEATKANGGGELQAGGALTGGSKQFDRALAPLEVSGLSPGGGGDTINNSGGNRSMNSNMTNHITVNGHSGESPGATANRYTRATADLYRNSGANLS